MFDPATGRLAHTNGDRALLDDLPPSPATPRDFAFHRLGRELDRAEAADLVQLAPGVAELAAELTAYTWPAPLAAR